VATKREPYQKYDSFVGLRHAGPLKEVTKRVRRVRARLEEASLPEPTNDIVRRACAELLGEVDAGAGAPRFSLHSYVVDEIGRVTDDELPRYLFYRYRYEMYPQRKILDDFPPCLQIEPTSVCNYRCVFCYQRDREFTKKANGYMGMMSLNLFKRVIDRRGGPPYEWQYQAGVLGVLLGGAWLCKGAVWLMTGGGQGPMPPLLIVVASLLYTAGSIVVVYLRPTIAGLSRARVNLFVDAVLRRPWLLRG